MPQEPNSLTIELREALTRQQYNPVVIHNYCRNADYFLRHLAQRRIALDAAKPDDVSRYLRLAARQFRKRRRHPPAPYWTANSRTGIHALLRHVFKRWPPQAAASDAGELSWQKVCDQYCRWLSVERGLAAKSIEALMWEAQYFCAWYSKRSGSASVSDLTVRDIDAYMDMRARRLTRRSLKDVAERLRSLLKHLYKTRQTSTNLALRVIGPLLYAYEEIPSSLSSDEIAAVLELTAKDQSPKGLRDHAILQLLAVYGLRAGEITHLRLEDIDWRGEVLHIRHSKTRAHSMLPLLEPVGWALIDYLQHGRPKTDLREIFIRSRAPYVAMLSIYGEVRQRIEAAGISPNGKRGPHIFRHARAVSLLRAHTPRKVIGDLLGHRSMESTIPYLKLATEDLRAICLEIPGEEVRA